MVGNRSECECDTRCEHADVDGGASADFVVEKGGHRRQEHGHGRGHGAEPVCGGKWIGNKTYMDVQKSKVGRVSQTQVQKKTEDFFL